MGHQHVRKVHAHGDGCQVFDGVIRQLHQVWRDGEWANRTKENQAAIGGACGRVLVGDVATSAALVIDDD